MKKLIMYLIIIVALSSCATQQNVQRKPAQRVEQSPEQPKSEIKDGKVVNAAFNVYSLMIIGIIITVLIVGDKPH